MMPKVLEELRQKTVKNFMDILILKKLKQNAMSGYDTMSYIHRRFGIHLSPGTVYSTMYSLEREGLIKGILSERKRTYVLTERGKEVLETVKKSNGKIRNLLRSILPSNPTQ